MDGRIDGWLDGLMDGPAIVGGGASPVPDPRTAGEDTRGQPPSAPVSGFAWREYDALKPPTAPPLR
eukprot:10136313-Lingulodinium_polyedra.AAC.1